MKLHMTLNISAIIAYGIAAIVCLVISVLSFMGRGYLLNNSYIYASQEKRMTTNWRPFYRQTAICFVFLTVFFIVCLVTEITNARWLVRIEIGILVALAIYAIVSRIVLRKKY